MKEDNEYEIGVRRIDEGEEKGAVNDFGNPSSQSVVVLLSRSQEGLTSF